MISFLSRRHGEAGRGIIETPVRRAARSCIEALESRTLLSVGLAATAQLKLLSTTGTTQSPVYHYDITVTDTGSTNVGTFWFGWIPGFNFLPATPSAASSPSGWVTPNI